jgi:SAM-dependent methyltransferase
MSSTLWNNWFGRVATRRLARRILPHVRRNQEIWGETIMQNLGPQVRWLDAGCGWRMLDDGLEPLEDRLACTPDFVVGIDLDFPHLQKHRGIARRVLGSFDALPFEDARFDLITCNMVVEHLPEPSLSFRELKRVLSPGGRIMVHTPNTQNYLIAANRLAKATLPKSVTRKLINDGRADDDIFPTFYRANSLQALHTLAKSLDLNVESARILTHPGPYTRFFAPVALFELMVMRATMTPQFERFGTTIMMTFRKPKKWQAGVAPIEMMNRSGNESQATYDPSAEADCRTEIS